MASAARSHPQSLAIASLPVALVAGVIACTAHDAPTVSSDIGAAQPIIGGEVDTAHPAVVAVFGGSGNETTLCSGTIVKNDPESGIAWVATAAHCVDRAPTLVLQTADFASSEAIRLRVIDWVADPDYTGAPKFDHDFAVVRVGGADENTPVLELADAPDGLASGATVTSVGFGRTTLEPPYKNTKRNAVAKKLTSVNALHLAYDMSESGICHGDSGGPVLAKAGDDDVERVVGIHSFVEGHPDDAGVVPCNGRGVSSRVTGGAEFLAGALGKALPAASCSLCLTVAESGKNACAALGAACLADRDCGGFNQCISDKKSIAECRRAFPLGEGPLRAAASCSCVKACPTECAADDACADVPKCGFSFPTASCASCVEGSCCHEASECAANGQCFACTQNPGDPKCLTNTLRQKLAACTQRCANACKDAPASGLTPHPRPDAGALSGTLEPGADEDPGAGADAPPSSPSLRTTSKSCSARGAGASAGSPPLVALVALALVAVLGLRRRRRT